MNTELFRPYRQPKALIRVELPNAEADQGLEVVTHVHALDSDENSTYQSPAMLRDDLDAAFRKDGQKIHSIPVRVEFDKPEHVLRSQFVMWSDYEKDFPMCRGNGHVGIQFHPETNLTSKVRCLGPSRCPLAKHPSNHCLVDARMGALLDGKPVEVRTNSENGFIALLAGLRYAQAQCDGKLSAALLNIEVWEKSTRGSSYKPFTAITAEFAGFDSGTNPVQQSMHEYGEQLLKEFDAQFAEEAGSRLDVPTVVLQVEGSTTKQRLEVQSESILYPMPQPLMAA